MQIDFELSGYGTVHLLRPITRAARIRVSERLPADAMRFGSAVVVEQRHIGPIVRDAIHDGPAVR